MLSIMVAIELGLVLALVLGMRYMVRTDSRMKRVLERMADMDVKVLNIERKEVDLIKQNYKILQELTNKKTKKRSSK